MLDIKTGEQVEALYKMMQIKGGKKVEKFKTNNIQRALRFHKWYVKRYKEGLLMEICLPKKIYDTKNKKVDISYE
jgi:hypothetical protein